MVTGTYLEESDGLVPSCINDSILIIVCSVPTSLFRIVNELSIKALLLPVTTMRKTLVITTIVPCAPLLFGVFTSTSAEFRLISMSVYVTVFVLSLLLLCASYVLTPLRYKALTSYPRIMEEEEEIAQDVESAKLEESSMLEEIESTVLSSTEYNFDDALMTYIGSVDELDSLGISPVDYMSAGFKRDLVTVCNTIKSTDSVGFDFDIDMEG